MTVEKMTSIAPGLSSSASIWWWFTDESRVTTIANGKLVTFDLCFPKLLNGIQPKLAGVITLRQNFCANLKTKSFSEFSQRIPGWGGC